MTKREKIAGKVASAPTAVRWADFLKLAETAGFTWRKGKRRNAYVLEREADQVTLTVHKPHGTNPVDPAAVRELMKAMKLR